MNRKPVVLFVSGRTCSLSRDGEFQGVGRYSLECACSDIVRCFQVFC